MKLKSSVLLLVSGVVFAFSPLDLTTASAQNLTLKDKSISSADQEDDEVMFDNYEDAIAGESITPNEPLEVSDDDVYVIDDENIDSDEIIGESPSTKAEAVPEEGISDNVNIQGTSYMKVFKKKSSNRYWGKKKRASKFLPNCSKSSASKSLSASRTENWSTNVSVTTDDLKYIKPTLGYTFSKSETFSDTTTISVKPGHIGWIDFTPLKYKAVGTLTTTFDGAPIARKNITMYTPKRLNGALDGADVARSRTMTKAEKKRFCK